MSKLPVLDRTKNIIITPSLKLFKCPMVQQELVGAQTRQSWVYPVVAQGRANAKLVRNETLLKVLLAQQPSSPSKMRS